MQKIQCILRAAVRLAWRRTSCAVRLLPHDAIAAWPRYISTHHSYVRGYALIHDSDAVSKVIRRELSIGVSQSDGTSFPASDTGGQMGLIAQTGLIDSIGLAEGQPTRGAELSFENLLKQAFQLGVLIVAAKAKADRWVECIEAPGAFVLEPSM